MKYYHLIFDYDGSGEFIDCATIELNRNYKYKIDSGEKINFSEGEILINYKSDTGILPDYLNNDYAWLIISQRCREIFENNTNPEEVQFINVTLRDLSTGNINMSYYIANVINVLDAIDLKNSNYSIYKSKDSEVLSIRKYAVKKSELKGQIFKLKDMAFPKFVSEKIMKTIKKGKLKGFAFTEIQVVL